ncbi:MAG: autotransporter domain-containing protein [Puniceicoccales bacterium]|jgi:uncharacterized protein with beta-barrel porin domain/subtilisin family serine protease|nr:autotransporter domain-containing protein [Puniceicoccales bacterium]
MSKLPLSLLVASAAMLNVATAGAAAYGPAFFPNDVFFPYNEKDLPNFAGQWHLVNQAPDVVGAMAKNAHLDVNITGAWGMGVTGNGVVIGIIDDGVEGTHEDLSPNYRADLSKNFSQDSAIAAAEQGPVQPTDQHGVSVAGVAAARGGNGIGVTGAAPYAQIAGQRISFSSSTTDPAANATDISDAFLWDGRDAQGNARVSVTLDGKYVSEAVISVKNNSWGRSLGFLEPENPTATDRNLYDKGNIQFKALAAAATNNVILVFAAGNDRGGIGEQAQTRFLNASDPVINVAALGSDGVYAAYSNFGSSVFVTAPSSSKSTTFGITTTDRMGTLGYNTYVEPEGGATSETLTDLPNANYTSTFGGTSSASPLVAGIMALGKQVTPAMDVRLAKHALVLSSRIVDAEDASLVRLGGRGWTKNAAGNSFNANYGFGLIDATKFVNTVIQSAYITDRTQFSTGLVDVGEAVVVGNAAGVERKVSISIPALQNQPLETVEARIKVTGPNAWQDLRISLTSPSGTVGDLLLYNNFLTDAVAPTDAKVAYAEEVNAEIPGFDWVFVANNFWGENANGEWTLNAYNRGFLNIGENIQWNNFELTFNMGRIVLESDSSGLDIAGGVTVKAHSLNLDYAPFFVRAGGVFTVTDSINVRGGTMRIYGTVDEASPNLSPEFFKGSLVTVEAGAAVFVEEGGRLVASRGVFVNGGDFVSRGTLEIGAGAVTVAANGSFSVNRDLDLQGAVDVGTDGSTGNLLVNSGSETDPRGRLSTKSSLRLGGGLIYAPDSITVGGSTDITGGRVFTTTYQGGAVTLAGGALSAEKLVTPAVTVNHGILNVSDAISGADGAATAVVINGEADKGKRGWYSPGGIGYVGEDLRGIGNLLFATKSAGLAAPIPGNITTGRVNGKTVVVRSEIDGSLTFGANGMLLVDVTNSPDGDGRILYDTLHVTGAVSFNGQLYINRIADRNGRLPHPKVGDEIVLITSDVGINKLNGGEIDSSFATMSPTLRYDVRTRDWVRSDSNVGDGNPVLNAAGDPILVADGQLYAVAVRDYVPVSANFSGNQKAVGTMLSTLWYDYQRAKGILSGSASLGRPSFENQTQGPVPFPPVSRPVNDGIAASPDAPDEYAYEDIFSSIDSVGTFDELRQLYTHLAPANSIVLEQSLRQKARAQTGAVRNRAREARASFIQNASIWTQSLFGGDSIGFNYSQPAGNYDPDHPFTIWLNGGGAYTPAKSNKNTAGYDSLAYNAAIGADYRVASGLLLGLSLAYSGDQTDFKDSGMKNNSDSVLGAVYAAGNVGGIHYNGLAGYSTDSHTLKRNVNMGDSELTGSHKGTPGGGTFLASVEVGYEWTTRGADRFGRSGESRDNFWSYGPSLAFQYYRSTVDSYTEKGDNLYSDWQRLSVGSQTYESLSTQLGFSISRVINLETLTILPEVRASWIHEFKTGEQQISSRFASVPGAESFVIQGNKPTSDYASFGAGITFRLFDSANASLNYDCYAFLKDTNPVHQVAATFRVNF